MSRLLLIGDGLFILLSLFLAYFVQATLKTWIPLLKAPPDLTVFATLAVLVLPVWFFFITRFRLHEMFDRLWRRRELLLGMVKLHLTAAIFITLVLFLTQIPMNRSLIALYLGLTFLTLTFERALIQFRMRWRLKEGGQKTHILLAGDDAEELRAFVRDARSFEVQTLIVGRIGGADDEEPCAQDAGAVHATRLGALADLGEVLHTKAVDQVMFFPPFNDPNLCFDALRECEALGVPACFYVHVACPAQTQPKLVSYHRYPFFIFEIAPKHADTLAFKHAFDTIAAALGLMVLFPFLAVIAFLVLVTMGRPVFFSQARSGLFGREFFMHKFRTMVKDAELKQGELSSQNEMDGPVFKIAKDPRVTRLGRFLRKWSIDELPQLFNVLKGDMSLVGPRPLPIKEQQNIVGWQRRRLSMRPGITGLWQVSGRNGVDFEQWMKLDLDYVDSWSLGMDFKILFKTIKVVLTGKGAS